MSCTCPVESGMEATPFGVPRAMVEICTPSCLALAAAASGSLPAVFFPSDSNSSTVGVGFAPGLPGTVVGGSVGCAGGPGLVVGVDDEPDDAAMEASTATTMASPMAVAPTG